MTAVTSHASERKARGITSPLRYVAGLLSEIRVAFRSLARILGVTSVALTLALGIGGYTLDISRPGARATARTLHITL